MAQIQLTKMQILRNDPKMLQMLVISLKKCQISTLGLSLSGIDPLLTHLEEKLLLTPPLY